MVRGGGRDGCVGGRRVGLQRRDALRLQVLGQVGSGGFGGGAVCRFGLLGGDASRLRGFDLGLLPGEAVRFLGPLRLEPRGLGGGGALGLVVGNALETRGLGLLRRDAFVLQPLSLQPLLEPLGLQARRFDARRLLRGRPGIGRRVRVRPAAPPRPARRRR